LCNETFYSSKLNRTYKEKIDLRGNINYLGNDSGARSVSFTNFSENTNLQVNLLFLFLNKCLI